MDKHIIFHDTFQPPAKSGIPPMDVYVLAEENGKKLPNLPLIAVEFKPTASRRSRALKDIFAHARLQEKPLPKIKKELSEYFKADRKRFTLPTKLYGTPFQKKVWESIQQVPHGKVISYMEINQSISGKAKPSSLTSRSIGTAVGTNPISIIIPCHRILNLITSPATANAKTANANTTKRTSPPPRHRYRVGHYGGGKPVKKAILALERAYEKNPIIE